MTFFISSLPTLHGSVTVKIDLKRVYNQQTTCFYLYLEYKVMFGVTETEYTVVTHESIRKWILSPFGCFFFENSIGCIRGQDVFEN